MRESLGRGGRERRSSVLLGGGRESGRGGRGSSWGAVGLQGGLQWSRLPRRIMGAGRRNGCCEGRKKRSQLKLH
jgi:hypothetical protein